MKYLTLINLAFLITAIVVYVIGTYASIDWKPMVPDQADKDVVVGLLYRMQTRAQEARSCAVLLLYLVGTAALFNTISLWFVVRKLRKVESGSGGLPIDPAVR